MCTVGRKGLNIKLNWAPFTLERLGIRFWNRSKMSGTRLGAIHLKWHPEHDLDCKDRSKKRV